MPDLPAGTPVTNKKGNKNEKKYSRRSDIGPFPRPSYGRGRGCNRAYGNLSGNNCGGGCFASEKWDADKIARNRGNPVYR